MPNPVPNTDERLRSYLDTNQLAREQLAAELLALDRRFAGVKPRHPRGGPDHGVDIEASYGDEVVVAAVGFVNSATDSAAEKRQIKKKYKADVDSAAKHTASPDMFVFFTNIRLTLSEKSTLYEESRAAGFSSSEIFDRERMRLVLDSPDGLGIRYRYLHIPLSDAEQAAFFSRWGEDIQRVIGSRFSQVELSLARLQFLYEAAFPLDEFVVTAELDREYSAAEIGHFRLFCTLYLQEPEANIHQIDFGSTDNSDRKNARNPANVDPSAGGIGRSMCGGAWIREFPVATETGARKRKNTRGPKMSYRTLSSFNSAGCERLRLLPISFGFGGGFIRIRPYLTLRNMDGCSFALFANRSLADKIKAIHVTGNEYKLAEFTGKRIRIDKPRTDPEVPFPFSIQELSDPWTRIMGGLSPFQLFFSDSTPLRMYETVLVEDSLLEMRRKRLDEYKKLRDELL